MSGTPHSNYAFLCSFTLGATASQVVDIDTSAMYGDFQLGTQVVYPNTSNPSNVSCNLKSGFASPSPQPTGQYVYVGGNELVTPIFDSAGSTVTLNNAATGHTGSQTTNTTTNISLTTLAGWLRLTYTNNDQVNSCTINLYGDE